jgi:hypothetical protein
MKQTDSRLSSSLAAALWVPRPSFWRRLAKTQRLTVLGVAILSAAILLAATVGATSSHTGLFSPSSIYAGTVTLRWVNGFERALDSTRAELERTRSELARARTLMDYSSRYNVSAELAGEIHDIALREGIDPELGFRLVYVESRFSPRAVSSAGALGLAQVLLSTARLYQPDLTVEQLFDRETNLGIGFRYLNYLLRRYDGNLQLALLAYNRGPGRVQELLADGIDPRNGYASSVLAGYQPSTAGFQ